MVVGKKRKKEDTEKPGIWMFLILELSPKWWKVSDGFIVPWFDNSVYLVNGMMLP